MQQKKLNYLKMLILLFPLFNLNVSYSETNDNSEKPIDINVEKKYRESQRADKNISPKKNSVENSSFKVSFNPLTIPQKNKSFDKNNPFNKSAKKGQIFYRTSDFSTREGHLYSMDIDSRKITEIIDEDIDFFDINYGLIWAPDGSTFAVEISDGSLFGAKYFKAIWNTKTSRFIKIKLPVGKTSEIKWSKDSSKILFKFEKDEDDNVSKFKSGLYVVNKDGSNLKLIEVKPKSDPYWYPIYTWASKNEILIQLKVNGKDKIFLSDLKGKKNEISKKIDFNCYSPKISPNSSKIIFISDNFKFFMMNKDGTNIVDLTNNNEISEGFWSPDSQKIAYVKFLPKEKSGLDIIYAGHLTH